MQLHLRCFLLVLLGTCLTSTVQSAQFSGHPIPARETPLSPAEAAKSFRVPEDLELELVLAEPVVRQPVFLNFDERGRMWVVQYLQYPAPAGLTPLSRDNHWRAVYDKVPDPPPRGVKGRDKITIHEDTDGDGTFDKHSTFVDGLNIATACARGRGGVWVLNPPYLLFYPDKNDDDVPDGDPVVHLEGFGLEDTHSVVNSLRWGPDGWLYAAQGSTVTGRVRRPGETNFVYSEGQNIWRYHPESRRYEIFAEGGGNAFGVEIDEMGRVFSGHNGGDTRGFYYMQGAYLRKGFEKHGELSNPYAFGYFPHMEGTKGERFTHNFILYQGGALPPRYAGQLFGVEPLQGRVVLSEFRATGSTYATRDIERVVTSSDSWFRPVDIKVGPDGAIYLCDWYDRQVTHTRSQEGSVDPSNGRIYRLKTKGVKPAKPFNLTKLSSTQLIETLRHTNLWFRQTAQRLLADRRDATTILTLTNWLFRPTDSDTLPLEALWALHASGGFSDTLAERLLTHSHPWVRIWTARLLGDERRVSPALARTLARVAAEPAPAFVLAQYASTAKRLPASDALPVIRSLLTHKEHVDDSHLPLLCWWALESKCEANRDDILALLGDSVLWDEPMVKRHILERLMRRFAAAGTRRDFATCAQLLRLSPSRAHSQALMKGFEEAFKGRSLAGLPDEFVTAMTRHSVGSEAFRLRRGEADALDRAMSVIVDDSESRARRLEFIQVLGEVKQPLAVPALLWVVARAKDSALRQAALTALQLYDDMNIGGDIVRSYHTMSNEVRTAAQTLLASRARWSRQLAEAVEFGTIRAADVPPECVRQMRRHSDEKLVALLKKHWPQPTPRVSSETQEKVRQLIGIVRAGGGDPYRGHDLFNATCATCHKLFAHGGGAGPDLTTYQRSDIEALVLNIVDPNAQIREGYENYQVEMTDERVLNGFLVERDDRIVLLRGADGQTLSLDRKDIATMKPAALSLMPEGLLDTFTDSQVRDLFAYLRSTQPLPR